jgi:carbonic anhydrase
MSRVLNELFDRNVAWATAKTRRDPHYFLRMSEQQSPRYLWIGCSDSRVTANDVLGLDPGEVFVHRNIANIVHTSDMNILSVLEFAILHLKVEHIIVCGHYGCSGINRVLDNESSAMVDHWLQPISMMHRKHRAVYDTIEDPAERLNRLCELNVEMQVRRVAATPMVENAWLQGQTLHLHGWLYAIHDGLLRDLGPQLSSIEERDALPSIDHRAAHPVEPISSMRKQAFSAFADAAEKGSDDPQCCADPELGFVQRVQERK